MSKTEGENKMNVKEAIEVAKEIKYWIPLSIESPISQSGIKNYREALETLISHVQSQRRMKDEKVYYIP